MTLMFTCVDRHYGEKHINIVGVVVLKHVGTDHPTPMIHWIEIL